MVAKEARSTFTDVSSTCLFRPGGMATGQRSSQPEFHDPWAPPRPPRGATRTLWASRFLRSPRVPQSPALRWSAACGSRVLVQAWLVVQTPEVLGLKPGLELGRRPQPFPGASWPRTLDLFSPVPLPGALRSVPHHPGPQALGPALTLLLWRAVSTWPPRPGAITPVTISSAMASPCHQGCRRLHPHSRGPWCLSQHVPDGWDLWGGLGPLDPHWTWPCPQSRLHVSLSCCGIPPRPQPPCVWGLLAL